MTTNNVTLCRQGLSRVTACLGITRCEVEALAKSAGDQSRVAEWSGVKEVAPGLSSSQVRKSYHRMKRMTLSDSLDMNDLIKHRGSSFIDAVRSFMVEPLSSVDGSRPLFSESTSLRHFVEACLTNDNLSTNFPSCDDTFLRWSFGQIRAELDLKSPLDQFPFFEDCPAGHIRRRFGQDPFFLEFPYHAVSDQVISQLPHVVDVTFDGLVPSPTELRKLAYEDAVPSSGGAFFDDATVANYLVEHSEYFEKNFSHVTNLLAENNKTPIPGLDEISHLAPDILFPLLQAARDMVRVYASVCGLSIQNATPSDIVSKAKIELDRSKRIPKPADMASIFVRGRGGAWSQRYRGADLDDSDIEIREGNNKSPRSYVLEDGIWKQLDSTVTEYYDELFDDPVRWALSIEPTQKQYAALVPLVLHLADNAAAAAAAATAAESEARRPEEPSSNSVKKRQ